MIYDVCVIGCGAAGMMAAYAAASSGFKTIVLEKNEKAGKKIYITGKGRCNVTNACDVTEFFSHVISNEKFLYSSIYGFPATEVMSLIESYGCKLKVERGERVFPVSDHSSDIIKAMVTALKDKDVEIRFNTEVIDILSENDEEGNCVATGVKLKDKTKLTAKKVIVATGGLSYPSTGSTGDGYRFAEKFGMKIVPTAPSLVAFETREKWPSELMGLSLKNVSVDLKDKATGKNIYNGFGEMLFTHFGVSGPLILTASCYYVKKFRGREANLTIDLKPALDEETLDKRLVREFEENRNKNFANAVGGLFPGKLIPVMVRLSGIKGEKKVHEITREERLSFVKLIKNLPLTVYKTGDFNEAVITQGGIDVKEINPHTMESKKVKNLFFAGEVLDVDAQTGGYNLQIAWSTGHLAGESC